MYWTVNKGMKIIKIKPGKCLNEDFRAILKKFYRAGDRLGLECLISTGAGDLAGRDQGVEQCNLYVSCKFVNNKHCRFLTEIRICVSEGIWQCIELLPFEYHRSI